VGRHFQHQPNADLLITKNKQPAENLPQPEKLQKKQRRTKIDEDKGPPLPVNSLFPECAKAHFASRMAIAQPNNATN